MLQGATLGGQQHLDLAFYRGQQAVAGDGLVFQKVADYGVQVRVLMDTGFLQYLSAQHQAVVGLAKEYRAAEVAGVARGITQCGMTQGHHPWPQWRAA
ncbi:hypothetical protein GLGCALEP_03646 [Pseudomonas sp. MM221]|nr:hypothetical protein GLGCALEP_03646 [Pseudomonas sp. MM221]